MIKDIDEYIKEATDGKQNISEGGSPAYRFGDLVLIKYSAPQKYYIGSHVRPGAEEIAEKANEKNAAGVRTPRHLALKRMSEDKDDVCWVLQEAAKGECFKVYCSKDNQTQLEMQARLVNVPEKHYEKLVNDIKELLHLDIEVIPKNVFYDADVKDGGFTIIDLLEDSGKPFDNSLRDVSRVWKTSQFVAVFSRVNYYGAKVDAKQLEILELSEQYFFEIKRKLFQAMERVIPNFESHRRWILRALPSEQLEYFAKNGIAIGDLTLTSQEENHFIQLTEDIISNSIEKVKTGSEEYWQIIANEIRNELSVSGMNESFCYHKKRILAKIGDKEDYVSACEKELEEKIVEKFNDVLASLENEAIQNTPLAKAISDLKNRRANQK